MINKFYFEGRCLVDKKGATIYNDLQGKLPIFYGRFENTSRRDGRVTIVVKNFLFLGNLATYARQNFAKDKYFILEGSFKKMRGTIHFADKENKRLCITLKGENLIVSKIYKSSRKFLKEETEEEKNLKNTQHNTSLKTENWELLARAEKPRRVAREQVREALRKIGIYEISDGDTDF